MKKLALLVAMVLAFSFTVLAQDTSTSKSQTSTETGTSAPKKGKKSAAAGETGAAKESQLTGCLAKDASGSGYTLTNGRYKKGVAVKTSEDISAHVGHQVKLNGTWEKPTAGEKGGAGPKGEEMRTFNATKLTHISDTCPAPGSKAGTKASKTTKSETAATK